MAVIPFTPNREKTPLPPERPDRGWQHVYDVAVELLKKIKREQSSEGK
jgi:hypothetical protein